MVLFLIGSLVLIVSGGHSNLLLVNNIANDIVELGEPLMMLQVRLLIR